MSEIKGDAPCPACRENGHDKNGNHLILFEDGGKHCNRAHLHADGKPYTERAGEPRKVSVGINAPLEFGSGTIHSRKLNADVVDKYGVKIEYDPKTREPLKYYFPYYAGGKLTGWKVRNAESKEFYVIGKLNGFFGQQNAGQGGRLLIITEGEFDAMAASQLLKKLDKNYRVVSLPNGANIKALKDNLEWLESFETVVLNFDNDEAGKKAVDKAVELFTPGKVKVMSLPVKDANEMVLEGHKPNEYYQCLGNAKTYRPDGIVSLADSWDTMFADDDTPSVPYPWKGLNKKLYGLRHREIVTITSGTGMGKSAVTREIEHWLLRNTSDNIGILALEESIGRTAWGLISVEASLPLSIREERQGVSKEQLREWFDATLGTGRVYTLDHFGNTSENTLLARVRYMIKALDCRWIVLDHLSIVVSAMSDGGDERKTIDSIMTNLRKLTEETGAGLLLVSHLRRTEGDRGHEQGKEVSLAHLRGSQAIAQLSDSVIALERNQQADDDREANTTTVRVLKNRYAGLTGIATHLFYDRETGRLEEIENLEEFLTPPDPEGDY